ncbi:hypothetical protein SDC9_80913 [bioreactor metagenome]|uniref:Teichoic acid poly(glycerol phosphate) polymerase n=1 Tax=bioreactor metagenome TaxID=1076179 RepID=A0A644Z2U4_9ZZZZ|nr:CDP-glycerol glycerophosphotransferase family protein [Romboutsia lituseburensis]
MDIINKIQQLIIENKIEQAFEMIIENENKFLNNSKYWNLKGMLCYKIQEYNLAINCYIKSIDIECDLLDSYFNLIYIYKLMGEKMKAALYSGVALKHTDDINFENELISIFEDDVLVCEYINLIKEVKHNDKIKYQNLSFIKYLATMFNDIDEEYINNIYKNNIDKTWAFVKGGYILTNKEIVSIEDFIKLKRNLQFNVMIKYDADYINVTRDIAKKGINNCFIIVENNRAWELIEIDSQDMEHLKNEDYKRTITLNKFNAADSNVYALIKYIPKKYKEKYKLNIIKGRDVLSLENIVKVPLISSVTISGFNTFTNYPKFTYNIDVGHAGIIMKNCGLMDKKYKNFSFTPQEYKQIDKVCVSSHMSMFIQSAFSSIPEDKYEITGNPRTDTLMLSNGRINLEKLLNKNLENKKIIFNMPTFHIHENSGVVNGEKFDDSIKINGFDYIKFNKFLKENNAICISKVHHAEERLITKSMENLKLENLLFVSNKELDEKNLDLYEILNCADILITDYSSIYGDFVFMNKPCIFVNADIDKYREERGISLEPYDFWTAGPKVQTQNKLELEIGKYLNENDDYKQKREELRDVFYKYKDDQSSLRVWDHIDTVLSEK